MNIKLNRNQLKYLVIVAMIIDHIAWKFVPTLSLLGQGMHLIGRLTGPTMAFMMAEGYSHTKNVKKYAIRLGIFALVSWPPFCIFEDKQWPSANFSVIYTLFLGLITIWIWDKADIKKGVKIVLVIVISILSFWGDWGVLDVILPLFLFIYRDDPDKKWKAFFIIIAVVVLFAQLFVIQSEHPFIQVFQFGAFLVIPLLKYCYNGESGSKHPFHKWFFYVFYPAHMLILAFIKMKI